MTRVTPAADMGSQVRSEPTAIDVLQHALEGGGDGELPDGVGQLAALDPEAVGAGGEVAADRVHAGVQPGHVGHQQALADRRPAARPASWSPGRREMAWQPAMGVVRDERTAEPVEATPERRPL